MSNSKPAPVILWFRKDLRLDDNGALTAAAQSGRPVICVYIREPESERTGPLGGAQAWWLHHSLSALLKSVEAIGGQLLLRSGKAADVLRKLAEQTGSDRVLFNRHYERDDLDAEIIAALQEDRIEVKRFKGQLLHDPHSMRTGTGGSYRVYTPFWKALDRDGDPREPLDPPKKISSSLINLETEVLKDWDLLPKNPNWAAEFDRIWTPGEKGAWTKLAAFTKKPIQTYKKDRDFPGLGDATSNLSPHLAFGEISPARVWFATRQLGEFANADIIHFRKELVWREFSYHLLASFPQLPVKNWNDKFDRFPWSKNRDGFTAWTRGMTGYPIVDAGMRQLWRHGYMHNRVRMITASFLIKDLMIDWRQGEAWFRDTLVDADVASNAANWQWVAGSGADAAPFFRVFNPILQGEKFDPDGSYVREFVPELAKLDNKYIHRPFDAPLDVLARAGVKLGTTYPNPVVDHFTARDHALAAYAEVTGRSSEPDPRDA
ncbi:cryptochrome/photolyase family protein [Rhizobium oryzicola]|uniref:Deoxyribodipyrimidine photo-lyase n=1 Tax=Rhizobium oryzicola TaxID=1232668 RepID=A0ABT8SZS5_9HYPH|nr:deoxyribodipyrimidine photo-lyase [Rhizobium oryzicola]MDO1583699.1 deoxyribodipyrimidine photo-lyase [Rhizobium oryzicola]